MTNVHRGYGWQLPDGYGMTEPQLEMFEQNPPKLAQPSESDSPKPLALDSAHETL